MKRRAFILSLLSMAVVSFSASATPLLIPVIIYLSSVMLEAGILYKYLEDTDYGDEIHARMDVHFLPGSEKIETEYSMDILEKFGSEIERYKDDTGDGIKIIIAGHADSKESKKEAYAVSKRRATYVKDYLIENYDFDESDMEIEAYGSKKPVASNATKEGRIKNRRVEFQMLKYKVVELS